MNRFNTLVKFGPAHFPVGTVLRLNENCPTFGQAREFTVTKIVQNDIRSFLIYTGVYVPWTPEKPDDVHQITFNIDWVEEIIKRGNGPLLVEYPNSHKTSEQIFEDDVCAHDATRFGALPRRGFYHTHSLNSVIHYELSRLVTSHTHTVSHDMAANAVYHQSWCKKNKWDYTFVINKKRLRKFLKANINRFLTHLDTLEKLLDEEEDRRMDMEFETDRLFGSSFDEDEMRKALSFPEEQPTEHGDTAEVPKVKRVRRVAPASSLHPGDDSPVYTGDISQDTTSALKG